MPKRVVVLGAGFGGLSVVKELHAHSIGSGGFSVTVIDQRQNHLFTPLLYETATGFFEHENLASQRSLRSGVEVDIATIVSRWGASFIRDGVAGIDWERRRVLLAEKTAVEFDFLVIALGSETTYYGIPGLAEFAIPFKSSRDAERIRQHVQDLLYRKETGKERRVEIMVGGAGATGVEYAGEVTLFLRKYLATGALKPEDFEISIVEARSRVLPMFDEQVSSWAEERLRRLGVRLHLDTCVRELHRTSVTLAPRPLAAGETVDKLLCDFRQEHFKDFDVDLFVWTGGIRGSSSLERLGVQLDDVGKRIRVNDTLEVPGKPDTFALGDAVVLMDPHTKRPVTWLAQAAMEQGKAVACSIVSKSAGGACVPFHFPTYPMIITVGGKWAIAVVGKTKLKGFAAWLLREAADLRYFSGILPFAKALRKWWHGLKVFSQND